jgi:hypothetical protein
MHHSMSNLQKFCLREKKIRLGRIVSSEFKPRGGIELNSKFMNMDRVEIDTV